MYQIQITNVRTLIRTKKKMLQHRPDIIVYNKEKKNCNCVNSLWKKKWKYYFLKKIKVVLFCTNFFGPPEWKFCIECVARVQKSCYFHEGGPKNACKMLLLFLKDDIFFHTACFFILILGFIFDNFQFPRKNWCKKVKLVQESKIDARK